WTTEAFAGMTSPVVSDGLAYTGSQGKVLAFDAAGGDSSCSGTPRACSPLWTADFNHVLSVPPTVADGVLYEAGYDGTIAAFDATGTGPTCSGTPKTCVPLWTAQIGNGVTAPLAVAGGVVYAADTQTTTNHLWAFDATGTTNCAGAPKVCSPLWTGTLPAHVFESGPTVAGGVVYVGLVDSRL